MWKMFKSLNSEPETTPHNRTDSKIRNALHKAVEAGNIELVQNLLTPTETDPIQLDAKDKYGNTPLHLAFASQHPNNEKIIDLFFNHPSSWCFDEINNRYETPLHLAAQNNTLSKACFEKILDKQPEDVINTLDKEKHSALFYVIMAYTLKHSKERYNDNPAVGLTGEEISMDVEQGSSTSAETILLEKVKLLLQAKADPNIDLASSPLHMAVKAGSSAVVELLLKSKANPNALDSFSNAPIVYAAESNNADVVNKLAAKTVLTGVQGKKAVKEGLLKQNVAILSALVSHGASPYTQVSLDHSYGESSSFSSADGHVKKNKPLRSGDNVLQFAERIEDKALIKLCLAKGIPTGKADERGDIRLQRNDKEKDSVDLAIRTLNPEIARQIVQKQKLASLCKPSSLLLYGASRGFKNEKQIEAFFENKDYQLSEEQQKIRAHVTKKYTPEVPLDYASKVKIKLK